MTEGERKALNDAYELGTIDKSQSHDLAGVGETGVEYSPIRTLNFEPEPLNFSVYPNPVNNDRLFVSTIGNYQLFNARGVLLQSYASTSTLAIGALTKGSYYIRNEAGLVVPFIVN